MAYTLDNLRTDIRNYTEVGSNVLSDTVLERLIKNAELKIHRAIDTDQSVFYATSGGVSGGGENCSAGPVTLEVVNG